ncbi:hypothetical protein H6F44_14550 [Pseudanabaena sp. FACHB-1277]|jgi:hypothetical protein|uniref:Uncharacterized protein n=1 Tax=Pseudanabaena cinerea FACHB-1277 TaxID=2949581 RepID=A0A926UWG6_9CYAN|nr:hypothetical protein [Pseudanabaena cinerea]MBD2151332.1 hypothetical protein [Pseudanabaena cinerea FACHB-1277]
MSKLAISLTAIFWAVPITSLFAEVPTSSLIAQTSTERAPLATYTGTMGATTISRSGASSTTARNDRRIVQATQGLKVSIQIDSYSSQSELNTIAVFKLSRTT